MKKIIVSLLLIFGISEYTNGQTSGYLKKSFLEVTIENYDVNKSNVFYRNIVNDTIMYSLHNKVGASQFFYLVNDTVVRYIINFHMDNKIIIYVEELPNKIFVKELWLDTTKPHGEKSGTYIDKGIVVCYNYNNNCKEPNPYSLVRYDIKDNWINYLGVSTDGNTNINFKGK